MPEWSLWGLLEQITRLINGKKTRSRKKISRYVGLIHTEKTESGNLITSCRLTKPLEKTEPLFVLHLGKKDVLNKRLEQE